MAIIKQGETSWKYLFLVLLSAVFIGGGLIFDIKRTSDLEKDLLEVRPLSVKDKKEKVQYLPQEEEIEEVREIDI